MAHLVTSGEESLSLWNLEKYLSVEYLSIESIPGCS